MTFSPRMNKIPPGITRRLMMVEMVMMQIIWVEVEGRDD